MNRFHPYLQTALKFGIMGGILIMLLFIVLVFFKINPMVANKKLDFGFIILPIFTFFAIKEYRDFKNDQNLRLWQGMIIGMLTVFFLSMFSALVVLGFLSLFGDEFLNQYIADRTALLEEYKEMIIENTSEDVYKNTYNDLQNVKPAILAIDDLLKKIFTGLFITLIISVVLRK